MRKRLIAILSCIGLIAGMALINGEPPTAAATTYNVTDHGGPVLNHTTNLHLLFWGPTTAWEPNEVQDITDFVQGLPGSTQMHLVDEYMRGLQATYTYNFVDVKFDQEMPPGNKSKGAQLQTELNQMWSYGDPNGLYIVISANYGNPLAGAWHDSAVVRSMAVPVIYIPDNTRAPGAQAPNYFWDQWLDSDVPGGKTGSAIGLLAHEVAEAATNPFTLCPMYCNQNWPIPPLANPAWYDASLYDGEVSDLCMGVQYAVSGTYPNLTYIPHYATMSNGQRFLVYGVWHQSTQSCVWA